MNENTRPELFIVLLVLCKHLIWAGLITYTGGYIHSTPLSMLTQLLHAPHMLALILTMASILTVIGLFAQAALTRTICFLPQQTLVSMTFISALEAVIVGQYADGVVRPFPFILSDQCPSMLIAVFHTVAVILLSKSRG